MELAVDGVDQTLNDSVDQTREGEGGGGGASDRTRPLSPTRLPFSHSATKLIMYLEQLHLTEN